MKTTTDIQYAAMCLQALIHAEDRALSALQISQDRGVPHPQVRLLLERFRVAGIVTASADGRYRLAQSAEELQVLVILQAIFRSPPPTDFRPLWPPCPNRGMVGMLAPSRRFDAAGQRGSGSEQLKVIEMRAKATSEMGGMPR